MDTYIFLRIRIFWNLRFFHDFFHRFFSLRIRIFGNLRFFPDFFLSILFTDPDFLEFEIFKGFLKNSIFQHDQELRDEQLYLDFEDYLGGVIQLSNELSRFTVNCVTNGDFQRPVNISSFLQEVLEGFRLLNLKNDNLRKKFDSIKYDMKKVEEVVYDLSIRGLIKKE